MTNKTDNKAKGTLGEDIACSYLVRQKFSLVERNYRKKWGEIDIIARKDNLLHFFEVKSVTGQMAERFFDAHKPEDNVDSWKTQHIGRMIQTFLAENRLGSETAFKFHVLCVYMNENTRKARVEWLKDIIL